MESVVPLSGPVVQTVVYQLLTVDVQLCVVNHVFRVESQLDLTDGLLALLETGHGHSAGGVHHLDQHEYLVLMLSDGLEPSTLRDIYWNRYYLNFLK